jgi:hypothetical protein
VKWIVVGILTIGIMPAQAADLCLAIALRDVAAIEAPDRMLPKGSYDGAISGMHVVKNTGVTEFCSHGGNCYPTHVKINGQRVEALRLTNCRVGGQVSDTADETIYSVDVIREKNSPEALRIDDLDNRFLEMGLCSACADNVAVYYVRKPASQCAALARQALEGNPDAVKQLRNNPPYCQYHR